MQVLKDLLALHKVIKQQAKHDAMMETVKEYFPKVDEPEYNYAMACLPDQPEQELNFED